MEITEAINMLTWPAAFAIVGSMVTIVVGLFGYMRNSKTKPTEPTTQAVHDRVSTLKDQVAEIDGDLKALVARVEGLQTTVQDHERRDVADFRAVSDKVEKIMEIIVEMLREKP